MIRAGGSISLRLAAGFMLVLAVFGIALVVGLYNLERIKATSEEVLMRQFVRRKALDVSRSAEDLYVRQSEFVKADGIDWDKVTEFLDVHEKMEDELRDLLARPVAGSERSNLEALGEAAARLRRIFLDEVLNAKLQAEMGAADPADLQGIQQRSRDVLDEISRLNEKLAVAFEGRAIDAETQTSSAWNMTLAICKSIFPLALLMSLLIIYYTHRSIVRPVGSLVAGTKSLARGDLTTRIAETGSGEFRELADSFNSMAGALETNQKELVEAEKMASVGRLAAGVAHEINNPIAVILGYTQMLLRRMPDGSAEKEQLEQIAEEARQCKAIVDGLLDLSRPSDPTRGEVVNPVEVINEVINTVQVLQLTEGLRLEESVMDKPLPLTISRARLRQLALNIVRNGLEAMRRQEDGRMAIEGYVRPRTKLDESLLKDSPPGAQSFLVLVFSDNGPGIPRENLGHLFEPFFTTKTTGMGLGLAITYNIARAHGGFIEVQSGVGEGTTFTVGLPLSQEV